MSLPSAFFILAQGALEVVFTGIDLICLCHEVTKILNVFYCRLSFEPVLNRDRDYSEMGFDQEDHQRERKVSYPMRDREFQREEKHYGQSWHLPGPITKDRLASSEMKADTKRNLTQLGGRSDKKMPLSMQVRTPLTLKKAT